MYFKVVKANYEDFLGAVLISISKANYDMSGIIWSEDNFVYDTYEKTVTITGGLPTGVTVAGYTGNKATAAGAYKAYVTFDYDTVNYNEPVIPCHGWNIEAAVQNVTYNGYAGVYDGNDHGITVNPGGGVVTYGETEGVYDLTESPIYADAGTYTVYFKVVRESFLDYYNFATVSITKANYDMSGIIWSADNFVYDGTLRSVTITGGLPAGVSAKAYTGNAATVVGNYQANATFNYDETNYNAPTIPCHGWSITKALQNVTHSGFEGAYDGTPHAIAVISSEGGEVTYLNTVSGDYDLTESPAYEIVGEYWVYFKVVKDNYEDYMGAALISISKAYYDMSGIIWSEDNFVYDGDEKTVTITGGLPAGVTVLMYTDNEAANAGLYTANATFDYDTDNYNEPEIPSHGWNIDKAPLTISAENKTVTFPQEAPPFTVGYSGFVNGEDETVLGGTAAFACAYDGSVYEATYSITPSGLTSGNYDIFFSAGILTVERASLAVPAALWKGRPWPYPRP